MEASKTETQVSVVYQGVTRAMDAELTLVVGDKKDYLVAPASSTIAGAKAGKACTVDGRERIIEGVGTSYRDRQSRENVCRVYLA